ncbi:transporter substrate-binding domain-containing protein [Paludibacterium sp. THUN1379]|uniref:substrate-binding periplasmic protein n=1 Tax=Paludibacterium sp. THUN1379 TaxID=3112107 RepID=UPI0030D22476
MPVLPAMRRCRGVLLILLLSCLPAALRAQPACQPSLRIALDEFGRYFSLDAANQMSGIDLEISKELARRLHCQPEIRVESVIRILKLAELGQIDLAAHKFATEERARIAWLVPYLRQHNVMVIRKNGPAPGMKAFVSQPQWLLGAGKGWHYGSAVYDQLADQLQSQGRLVLAADTVQLFAMLRANRVQAIITSAPVYRAMLSAEELGQYRLEDWDGNTQWPQLNLMLSRQTVDDALKTRIVTTLQEMRSDGTLRDIVQKYVGPEEAAIMLKP